MQEDFIRRKSGYKTCFQLFTTHYLLSELFSFPAVFKAQDEHRNVKQQGKGIGENNGHILS